MNHDAIDGIPIDYADLYQQAQQASERLQLALDAGAIIGTWVWDVPADRFTADERFARSFGLSPDLCLKGLPLELVTTSIHTDDFAHVQSKMTDALGRGGAYRCEYRVLQSDGVYRWVEANGRVELDEGHKPLRFPGVLIDIEARRVAEAERDRLNTLLRTFTAAVPGVVFAKDRQGRMLVANQGTTELIGKSPEFYIGKTDVEYLDDPQQGRVIMATDRRIMESGVSEQVEEEVRLADGSAATWLSAKAPLFDESGEVIGLIGSSIDVTDRKKAEDALKELNQTLEQRILVAVSERENIEKTLRHSQKMEVVGQLTGGIAHDFNNILAGISGSLELMQTRLAQGRSADVDKYLAVAQSAVKRASALTHRLLAFSRRQTLTPQLTDVKALIEGMVELISRAVGPSISIDVNEMEGLWPALIDSAQLENSLLNLCLNARDSMPDGGRIVISASNEWLERNDELDHEIVPGRYLRISISDNGSGMTAETLSKAFEPFFTTKPFGTGTGLGLSMVFGFTRQSGGDTKVESAPGRGTTVSIFLPRHDGHVMPNPDEADISDDHSGRKRETILIVDDEPSIRMLVADVLSNLGYATLEAADGVDGLKILQSDAAVDLLITDVGLPGGMNGRQMAGAGRKSRPNLPVLFITGYAESAVLKDVHLEPNTHVLTKPFGLDVLTSLVADLVE